MVDNDKKYKQVTSSIGVSLIFLVVFTQGILFTVPSLLESLLEPLGTKVSYTVSMLSQIILYLASFIGPAFILRKMLKKRGCRKIKLMSIIAAPEGVDKVASAHPDVDIFVSTLDRCLNEHGYILPGLGDAGDRIFGTK